MAGHALEPASRPLGWSGEVKEEMARKEASKVDKEDHAGPSRPMGGVWAFMPAPTVSLKDQEL